MNRYYAEYWHDTPHVDQRGMDHARNPGALQAARLFCGLAQKGVAVDRKSSYVGGVTRRKFMMFNSAAEIKIYALAGHATVNPPYI